ncbi:MAG: shikimate dehydrogenase [Pseudomonadales bacterium]|nr:shikimate dehydrogenase [Pseudomonadales bacterium]
MEKPHLLAVFGYPVAHSRSPLIHAAFGQETGIALSYGKREARPGHFGAEVDKFVAEGALGFNITVPFKAEAFALAQQVTERARQAKAVNTMKVTADGELHGHNTDGDGLLADMTVNLGWKLSDSKILVVGAGGAVAGVIPSLLQANPSRIDICNRTISKAEAIAAQNPRTFAVGRESLLQGYDIVLNGTSAGLAGELPDLPATIFASHSCSYDMIYGDKTTSFNQWALDCGAAQAADGLGMLVEQAALAFEYWFETRPATAPVISMLRHG